MNYTRFMVYLKLEDGYILIVCCLVLTRETKTNTHMIRLGERPSHVKDVSHGQTTCSHKTTLRSVGFLYTSGQWCPSSRRLHLSRGTKEIPRLAFIAYYMLDKRFLIRSCVSLRRTLLSDSVLLTVVMQYFPLPLLPSLFRQMHQYLTTWNKPALYITHSLRFSLL